MKTVWAVTQLSANFDRDQFRLPHTLLHRRRDQVHRHTRAEKRRLATQDLRLIPRLQKDRDVRR
jgi:hypothetical protein